MKWSWTRFSIALTNYEGYVMLSLLSGCWNPAKWEADYKVTDLTIFCISSVLYICAVAFRDKGRELQDDVDGFRGAMRGDGKHKEPFEGRI
jgi:hypothetical protein